MIQNTRKSARAADYTEDLRIRKWLQPANASINYVTASRLCHRGTGAWFLKSAAYKTFLQAPHGRLWLRGIPGSGKTVLASTIIRELECADEGPESALVYFFFAFNDDSKQQLEHMLRSLIFQLSNLHTFGRTHLTSCFEKFKEGYEQPSTESLVDLFDQMVCDLRSVTIVLDALDESTGTQSILRWITSRNHCKFVLTGRPESDIEKALTLWLPSDCAITLENEPVHNDIKAYVQHNLETERNLSRWKSMHNFISDTLVKKAGGMSVCSTCPLSSGLLRWKYIFANRWSGFDGYIASLKSSPGVWINLPYDSCCRLSLSTSIIPMTVSSITYRARELPTPSSSYSFLLSQTDRCRFES